MLNISRYYCVSTRFFIKLHNFLTILMLFITKQQSKKQFLTASPQRHYLFIFFSFPFPYSFTRRNFHLFIIIIIYMKGYCWLLICEQQNSVKQKLPDKGIRIYESIKYLFSSKTEFFFLKIDHQGTLICAVDLGG